MVGQDQKVIIKNTMIMFVVHIKITGLFAQQKELIKNIKEKKDDNDDKDDLLKLLDNIPNIIAITEPLTPGNIIQVPIKIPAIKLYNKLFKYT